MQGFSTKKKAQKARLTFSLGLVHCDKHENKEQKGVDVISMLHGRTMFPSLIEHIVWS